MSCLEVVIRSLRYALDVALSVAYGLCVRLSRLGGVASQIERLGGAETAVERISTNISTNIGLICSVGVGKYEYLECSDLGFIRTYDKGFIIVPKR